MFVKKRPLLYQISCANPSQGERQTSGSSWMTTRPLPAGKSASKARRA